MTKILYGGFRKIKTLINFSIMNLPMPRTWRWHFAKWGGVNMIYDPEKGYKRYFIAEDVNFDTVYPQNITIYNEVHITRGCTFLTHHLDTKNPDKTDIHWQENKITIMPRAFIGTNTIVCSNVTIGEGAIVGAGSVVTKDIPPFEIWGGNPAHFIKKRGI